MTITTKKWPPAVILKSSVACASCAVRGFLIPHLFNLLKLDNVAKIFEVCSETAEVWYLYLFLTDIPPRLYRRSQRHEQPQEESPTRNLNPTPFYLCPRSFGVSPPLPRTTRHSHRLHVGHDTSVTLSATKGHRQPG